jgi:hypothetical protein
MELREHSNEKWDATEFELNGLELDMTYRCLGLSNKLKNPDDRRLENNEVPRKGNCPGTEIAWAEYNNKQPLKLDLEGALVKLDVEVGDGKVIRAIEWQTEEAIR